MAKIDWAKDKRSHTKLEQIKADRTVDSSSKYQPAAIVVHCEATEKGHVIKVKGKPTLKEFLALVGPVLAANGYSEEMIYPTLYIIQPASARTKTWQPQPAKKDEIKHTQREIEDVRKQLTFGQNLRGRIEDDDSLPWND